MISITIRSENLYLIYLNAISYRSIYDQFGCESSQQERGPGVLMNVSVREHVAFNYQIF